MSDTMAFQEGIPMDGKETKVVGDAPATQDQPPLIYARMSAVMADIGAIDKDKTNKQQGFKYRGIDDIYNALHLCMAKHQVFTTSEALDVHREEKPTKSGGKIGFSIVKIRYTFHTVDGSSIATEIIGEGMDTADKATNKAFAIAHKYALLQAFMIPTEDPKDPEADSPDIEWITQDQVATLADLIKEAKSTEALFLQKVRAQSLERIQASAYKDCVKLLENRKKQLGSE